jgi:hypothetical protein
MFKQFGETPLDIRRTVSSTSVLETIKVKDADFSVRISFGRGEKN